MTTAQFLEFHVTKHNAQEYSESRQRVPRTCISEGGNQMPEERMDGCGLFGTRWAWIIFLVLILLLLGTWGGQFFGV